jgi:hypothetical protein
MQTHLLAVPLALGITLAALTVTPAPARAHDGSYDHEEEDQGSFGDLALAVDLNYDYPIESLGESGGGFAIRAGWQLHVPLLVLTPEAGFSYDAISGGGDPTLTRGFLGLRAGFGEIFRFGAFGHLGLCGLSVDAIRPDPSRTGLAYDLGLFFDFTLLPLIDLGVHAAYNHLVEDDLFASYQWLTLGAHVALIL